ncbi:hypothetical protein OBBRIDRAFT_13760 [Obba rivulosa]|uniref:F-box domain-containing protein n=1 Tax=Obba rivulosa TaxID=1052685 RepID=A0A8E2DVU1_9APHY|nr:hypothetical protein OBBRIDRAFT_13760 [Obba rivulosa]
MDDQVTQPSTASSSTTTTLVTHLDALQIQDDSSAKLKLPAEICDYIIDELQDDRAALESCSLTCRSWLPRARHYLFNTINLDVFGAIRLHKLLAENAEFGAYVQHLGVSASQSQPDDPPLVSLPNIAQSLVGQMPNATTLKLESWRMLEPVTLHSLSGIRYLRLHSCTISSKFALRLWLEAVPNVEEVELQSVGMEEGRFDDRLLRLGASVLPQLVNLRFLNAPYIVQEFMDVILAGRIKPNIKFLYLDRVPSECISTWSSWFQHVAPSLEHLQFRLQTTLSALPMLNVGLCTQLRVLDLSVSWPNVERSFVVETLVLKQLSSPHLKTIYFKHVTWWTTFLPSSSPHWTVFVALLASSKFSSLERLSFYFRLSPPRLGRPRGPTPGEIFDEIRQSLPEFDARGVLEFCH